MQSIHIFSTAGTHQASNAHINVTACASFARRMFSDLSHTSHSFISRRLHLTTQLSAGTFLRSSCKAQVSCRSSRRCHRKFVTTCTNCRPEAGKIRVHAAHSIVRRLEPGCPITHTFAPDLVQQGEHTLNTSQSQPSIACPAMAVHSCCNVPCP